MNQNKSLNYVNSPSLETLRSSREEACSLAQSRLTILLPSPNWLNPEALGANKSHWLQWWLTMDQKHWGFEIPQTLSFFKDKRMLAFLSKPEAPWWKIQVWYAAHTTVSVEWVTPCQGLSIRASSSSEGKVHAPGMEYSWPWRGARTLRGHWLRAAHKVLVGICVEGLEIWR